METNQPPQDRPKLTSEKAQELADYLVGTCNTIDAGLAACGIVGAEDEAEAAMTEKEIFLCNTCGWWCSMNEAQESDDGDVCTDCAGDAE